MTSSPHCSEGRERERERERERVKIRNRFRATIHFRPRILRLMLTLIRPTGPEQAQKHVGLKA